MSNPDFELRTYRSHSQPACIPCRKRKSRCKLDAADRATCLMCKLHGTFCTFPDSSVNNMTRSVMSTPRDQRRLRRQVSTISRTRTATPCQRNLLRTVPSKTVSPTLAAESIHSKETPFPDSRASISDNKDESHVIGPVQSPDTQLISNYLLNDRTVSLGSSQMIVTRPNQFQSGQRPTLFHTVRRHPLGHTLAQTAAASRCEVVVKLIEPYCDEIIDVYFAKVHPCFPVLDERTFKLQYGTEKEKISPVILSSLYAQTIVYWRCSSQGVDQRCPDLRFIWNQANQALNSELYLSPGITTITAILLNISGRPLTSMMGNGILLSSAISLAHSLGLNRNCQDWSISCAEKRLRTRLWWAILIYDRWSSVTHGTPPQLRTSQHDVQLTPADGIDQNGETYEADISSTFVALATLSGVLDTYLDYVFNLHHPPSSNNGTISIVMEKRLSQWVDSLPEELRRAIIRGTNLQIRGSANLRLSYLYARLLAQKLGIDSIKQNHVRDQSDLDYRLMQARQAAENIVLFIQELDDMNLSDFWLSFNAFALSGTVSFLIRTALESQHSSVGTGQSRYLKLASDMILALQAHRQRMNWDLGNICIAQYADIIEKLVESNSQPLEAIPDFQQFCLSDFIEADQLSPDLWDMFNDVECNTEI